MKGSRKLAVKVDHSSGSSVIEYLALPVSAYSILDPSCIRR